MPVEIRELMIRAVVSDADHRQSSPPLTPEDIARLKKEITREVTEKVLKTLQQKNER